MKKKVAIQGIAGSYHDIAARNYHEGEEIEIIPCNTFRDVITTIKKDPSVLGMMAIENTIAGSLLQNHELIRESGLSVTGEYKLRYLPFLGSASGNLDTRGNRGQLPSDSVDAMYRFPRYSAQRQGGRERRYRHECPVDLGKPTERTCGDMRETGCPDLQDGSPCRGDRD